MSGRVAWVVDGDTFQVRADRRVGAMRIRPDVKRQALVGKVEREAREAGRGLRGAT